MRGAPPIPPLAREDHVCSECGVAYASIEVAGALEAIRAVPRSVLPHGRFPRRSSGCVQTKRRGPYWSMWATSGTCTPSTPSGSTGPRVEERPMLEPIFNEPRAARFRYNNRDLGPIVAELADNVAGLIDEAARVSDEEWNRVARRLPGEERTARWLVRQAMHEGTHHLLDISTVSRRLE